VLVLPSSRTGLPAGINARRSARAGSDPEHENKYEHSLGFRGCRSYDRRGVAPSPALRPEAESGIRRHEIETRWSQRISRTVKSGRYASKCAIKGGVDLVSPKCDPDSDPEDATSFLVVQKLSRSGARRSATWVE